MLIGNDNHMIDTETGDIFFMSSRMQFGSPESGPVSFRWSADDCAWTVRYCYEFQGYLNMDSGCVEFVPGTEIHPNAAIAIEAAIARQFPKLLND